jgi:hypothetical protein
MVGWGVALLVLSSAGVASAAEAVAVARPAERIVVSADVGGGWTQAGFRYGATDAVVSAPSFNAKALVGYRTGNVDLGFVAGGLVTSSFNGDYASGQPTPRTPDSLRLAHAGGFATWHPAWAERFAIGGRVEAAYAWLPQTEAAVRGTAATAVIATATVYGGIGALDASYALISTPRVGVIVAAELFAGALRGDWVSPIYLYPRGGAASVGLRWP